MINHEMIISQLRRAFATGTRFNLPKLTGADLRLVLAGLTKEG